MSEINPSLIDWPAEMPPYSNFEAAVQGENARWNSIGLASGIVRNGERQIAVTGFANMDAGYAMNPNSMFLIASITKTYVATLVMRLMEQGILDLDTPVVNYIPDFKLSDDDVRDAITIRMLLSHSSGFDGDRFTAYGRGDDAYQKAVSEFHTLAQWFKPGSFYSYNNAGFYLIGHIMKTLTGKTFEDLLTEELITPMGLQHTAIQPENVLNHAFAAGHTVSRTDGVKLTTSGHLPRQTNAAGGIIQSIGDLLTFAQMHLNKGEVNGKRIISAENVALMQEPVVEADTYHRHYGIGWSIFDRPNGKSIGHGGSWGGHRANLIIYPYHNFAHATLGNSNMSAYAYSSIEKWTLKHHLNIENPDPAEIEMSPLELSRFVGTYARHDSRMTVTQTEKGLRLAITDIDEDTGEEGEIERLYDLAPTAADRFRVTSPESLGATVDIKQVPDAQGNLRDLLRLGGRLAARVTSGS